MNVTNETYAKNVIDILERKGYEVEDFEIENDNVVVTCTSPWGIRLTVSFSRKNLIHLTKRGSE